MKTIVFIVPYFGKFPNYYQLWLQTCSSNPTIDFFVITDIKDNNVYPKNVKKIEMSFSDVKKRAQALFDFRISLDKPYKLCDFKPAYGEVFSDLIEPYDYWGHCDIDLFWGDIRKFVTDTILDKYIRIYPQGYCSIYRNEKKINSLYRTMNNGSHLNWKNVYQSSKSWCFDEWAGHLGGGISEIMMDNNIAMYTQIDEADVNPNNGRFKGASIIDNSYFEYDGKSLFEKNSHESKEVLLVHFQRRDIVIDENINLRHFYLIDPYFVTNCVDLLHKNRRLDRIKHVLRFTYQALKRSAKKLLL